MKQVKDILRSAGVLSPKDDSHSTNITRSPNRSKSNHHNNNHHGTTNNSVIKARLLEEVHIHHNLILDHLGDDFFFSEVHSAVITPVKPVVANSSSSNNLKHSFTSPFRKTQKQTKQSPSSSSSPSSRTPPYGNPQYPSPKYVLKSLQIPSNVLFNIPGEMHFIDHAGDVYVICKATKHLTRIYRSLKNPIRHALILDQLDERSLNEWKLLSELSSTFNLIAVSPSSSSTPTVSERASFHHEEENIISTSMIGDADTQGLLVRLVKYTDRSCSTIQWMSEPYDDLISEDDGIYGYLNGHRERILDPFNVRIDTTSALKDEEAAVYALIDKYFATQPTRHNEQQKSLETKNEIDEKQQLKQQQPQKRPHSIDFSSLSTTSTGSPKRAKRRSSVALSLMSSNFNSENTRTPNRTPKKESSTNTTSASLLKEKIITTAQSTFSTQTRNLQAITERLVMKSNTTTKNYQLMSKHPPIRYSFDHLEFELIVGDYHFPMRYSAFEIRGDELYGLPIDTAKNGKDNGKKEQINDANLSITPPLSPSSTTSDIDTSTPRGGISSPNAVRQRAGTATFDPAANTILMSTPMNGTLMKRREGQQKHALFLQRRERDRWVRLLNANKESLEMVNRRTHATFTRFYQSIAMVTLIALIAWKLLLIVLFLLCVLSAYRNSLVNIHRSLLHDVERRVDHAIAKDEVIEGIDFQFLTSMTREELLSYLESYSDEMNFCVVRIIQVRIPHRLLIVVDKTSKSNEDHSVQWIFVFGICFHV